jgi:hypothetical protein
MKLNDPRLLRALDNVMDWPPESEDRVAAYVPMIPKMDRAEYLRDYMREYRKAKPAYRKSDNRRRADKKYEVYGKLGRQMTLPFAGVDSEGATITRRSLLTGKIRKESRLVLFRAGKELLLEKPGKGLAWYQILDFLCNVPKDYIYVSFSFGYDVGMIFRTYPANEDNWKQICRLVKDGHTLIGDNVHGWWAVEYRPKGYLGIRPVKRETRECTPDGFDTREDALATCQDKKRVKKQAHRCRTCQRWHLTNQSGFVGDLSRGNSVRISDTFKFFLSSFVDVIDGWDAGTPETRQLVREGKDERGDIEILDKTERDRTIYYNLLECDMLAEVMTKLRQEHIDVGLHPAFWESPGYTAKAMLRKNGIPKTAEYVESIPEEVLGAAWAAYYGGWNETSMVGPIQGLITGIDRNSAYPDSYRYLPCPEHTTYERRRPERGEYALQLVHAQYEAYDYKAERFTEWGHPLFMGLPHRNKDGRISRPVETRGWYWNFEIAEARHQTITVYDSWTVAQNCKCEVFNFVPELYAKRLELKKVHKNKGMPIKLGLNAIYGSMAQNVGSKQYTNPINASFITAWIRTAMMNKIHELTCERGLRCGETVTMVATDGIFVRGNTDVISTDALGGWDVTEYPNGIFQVQGGVYWPPGEKAQAKTRGVPKKIINEHRGDFEDAFRKMVTTTDPDTGLRDPVNGVVTLRWTDRAAGRVAQRFVGLFEAVQRGQRTMLGQFIEMERKLGFNWEAKRVVSPENTYDPDEPLRTIPKTVPEIDSLPYDKVQLSWHRLAVNASRDVILDKMNDSPDWLDALDTPGE